MTTETIQCIWIGPEGSHPGIGLVQRDQIYLLNKTHAEDLAAQGLVRLPKSRKGQSKQAEE